MNKLFTINTDYTAWLRELKDKIRTVQMKAMVSVNAELLNFYWDLGAEIVAKQTTAKWGGELFSQTQSGFDVRIP